MCTNCDRENWFTDLLKFLGVLGAVAVQVVVAPYRHFRPKKSPWLCDPPEGEHEFVNQRLQEPWPAQQYMERRTRPFPGEPVLIVECNPTVDDVVREALLNSKRRVFLSYGDFIHEDPSPAMEEGRRFHEEAAAHFAADVLRAAERQRETESRSLYGAAPVVAREDVRQDHLS